MGKKKTMAEVFKKIIHSPLFWILLICLGIQTIYYSQVFSYEICGDTASYTYEYDPSFRTPVYPLFGNVVRFFTGDEETVWLGTMSIIQKIIMFASIFLFWGLVCDITKNKYMRFIATVVYGSSPAIFSWAACILTEAFSIVEIVALMYFTVKYLKYNKKKDAFLSGIMILLLVLTRPAAVYLLVVYVVFWGAQLFVAIRRKKKKIISSVRIGIIGLVMAICGVLGYCFVQKIMFNEFGLSSVSYVNDLLIVIDTDLYKQSSNDEIREYIIKQKETTSNNYKIIWQGLMKEYSRDELEGFTSDVIQNNRLDYIEKIVKKAVQWGIQPAARAQNSFKGERAISSELLAGLLFPISFGLVYMIIIGMFIWLIIRVVRKRRLDWVLLTAMMLIGGNVGVTIIAAPYDPARLCTTSLPVLIIVFVYIIEIVSKYGGRERIESLVHKR